MKKLLLCSAAIWMAGLMLMAGCGQEEAAPAKKSEAESASNVDSGKADVAAEVKETADVAENKRDTESAAMESADAEPSKSKITMADFEGFLPSDPIESVDLTDAEKMASQMSADDGKDKVESSSFVFEAPVRLKGGDEYVKVDAPGYACPTMADVDGDGKKDLVVGQFSSGKMRLFQNISKDSDAPEFASESWIKSGDKIAEVPGVW